MKRLPLSLLAMALLSAELPKGKARKPAPDHAAAALAALEARP